MLKKCLSVVMTVSVVMLFAAMAFAGEVKFIPGANAKEYSAEYIDISNIDVPLKIISDSGKTIRIKSEIPLTLGIKEQNGKLFISGESASGKGASVSNKGSGNVRQETQGDSSPAISSSGNVNITYGNDNAGKKSKKKRIIIRMPRGVKLETRGISGDLETIY